MWPKQNNFITWFWLIHACEKVTWIEYLIFLKSLINFILVYSTHSDKIEVTYKAKGHMIYCMELNQTRPLNFYGRFSFSNSRVT